MHVTYSQCDQAKGQASRQGVRLSVLSKLKFRSRGMANLPQHNLHHVSVARAQVEETHAHHGGCLHGMGDLHVCGSQRQERREVDGEQTHQGGGHAASPGGWKVGNIIIKRYSQST